MTKGERRTKTDGQRGGWAKSKREKWHRKRNGECKTGKQQGNGKWEMGNEKGGKGNRDGQKGKWEMGNGI